MLRYYFLLLTFLFPALLLAQKLTPFDADADRAYKLIESGRLPEAKPIVDRLLQRAASETDASALNDLGELFEKIACYSEAETLYKRALEIREKKLAKNHNDTIQTLNNLAILYRKTGQYIESDKFSSRAIEAVGNSDDFIKAILLNNLGLLYQEQYRYAEADRYYNDALKIYERLDGKDGPNAAEPLHNLARLYRDQGAEQEFYEERVKSQERFKESERLPNRGVELEFNFSGERVNSHVLFRESERLQKRALAIDEKELGKNHPEYALSLNGLANLYREQKRYAESEAEFKQALNILVRRLGNNHPWTADTMNDLAELYDKQGRLSEAEPLYNHAINVYNSTTIEARVGQLWYKNRALLYKKTNRTQEAIKDLKAAMRLSQDVRKQVAGNDQQRAHTFSRYYNLFETMVDWQYELGDMNEAFETMEWSRAQGLQDILDANNVDLLAGLPAETARKLRDAESAARAEIAAAERAPNQANLLRMARIKLETARGNIRAASPAYQWMIAEGRKPVVFDTIRNELSAEKTLALEYLIGGEKSYLLIYGFNTAPKLMPLVLSEQQAKLLGVAAGALTAKKLEVLLMNKKDGVLEFISKRPSSDGVLNEATQNKLAVLWHVFIPDEQIREKIKDGQTFRKLLILPDSTLACFPFEALIVERNGVEPQYVLDLDLTTIYAPSATVYYRLKHHQTERGTGGTLTVGNPSYGENLPGRAYSGTRSAELWNVFRYPYPEIPEIKQTGVESDYIVGLCETHKIPVTQFTRSRATEANVRNNVAGKKIVHLACHGLGSDSYTALALTIAKPELPSDDGFLEFKELFDLKLKSCELAVLSACQTNLGETQRGEGTWSMGRGMMASGAKRVVTSNWIVDDIATADLMSNFIEKVYQAAEPDYASALRQAKREIRSSKQRWQHPFYWAPFVFTGVP